MYYFITKKVLGISHNKFLKLQKPITLLHKRFQEGALTKREKQLIALGISLATQDEYCTIYHTKGCIDQGCSDKEILEACGVSTAFAGGAAMSQAVTLVQECMVELKNQSH